MKIRLICVGTKMPAWVEAGVAEYRKRLPREFELGITEIPMAQRSKSIDSETLKIREGEACLKALSPGDFVIALDVLGKTLSTESMAAQISTIRDSGRHISMLAGGPDGLSAACLERADAIWSLSALTFPHPVVRVILAEQLYRVWSLLNGHPYHRA